MGDSLDGGEGTVATRPERRPRDQDRRGAARCRPVFPFGIGTKAVNRDPGIISSLPFIPAPRFLHFTLNHYKSSHSQWVSATSWADRSTPSAWAHSRNKW